MNTPDQPIRLAQLDTTPNMRTRTLQAADAAVNGDRNADYGDPNQDFARTASFWNTYITGVAWKRLAELGYDENDSDLVDVLRTLLQPHDVAHMQVLLKVSRAIVSPGKHDHYVDIAGYAACGAHCAVSE